MVALPPEDQEHAVQQYVIRTLTLLEETETSPEKLDGPTMQRTLVRLAGLAQALTQRHKLDKHGQCPECLADRTIRDVGCGVMPIAAVYLVEPPTVVWWQIFTHQGTVEQQYWPPSNTPATTLNPLHQKPDTTAQTAQKTTRPNHDQPSREAATVIGNDCSLPAHNAGIKPASLLGYTHAHNGRQRGPSDTTRSPKILTANHRARKGSGGFHVRRWTPLPGPGVVFLVWRAGRSPHTGRWRGWPV